MVTPSRDDLIAGAKSLADLVTTAQAFDPQLAAQLTAKPLLASKSVWGVALSSALAPLVAGYGLGLSPDIVNLFSGVVVTGVAAGLRAITKGPISGIVTTPDQPAK